MTALEQILRLQTVSCLTPMAHLARSTLRQMASAELSRRVEKVVGCPPLSEMGELQRREFHEAPLDAERFEDVPGKWQAAIVAAEQNRPDLRVVRGDSRPDQ